MFNSLIFMINDSSLWQHITNMNYNRTASYG